MWLAVLWLGGCGDPDGGRSGAPLASAPAVAPEGAAGPFVSGAGAEDMASSWEAALATEIGPPSAAGACRDADEDGFRDAWSCPAVRVEQADCDDADPQITPANERYVAPGPFLMGSSSAQSGRDEGPVHVVTLSGYCLDRFELAQGDLVSVQAPGGQVLARRPAEGIAWLAARDVCVARGKTLPTEAQWEKAARGGCEGGADAGACDARDLRAYPWGGEVPTCARANHQVSTGGPPTLCVGHAVDVDTELNVGPYGHVNLAGNVWEWVADAWNPGTYARAPARVDPTGPPAGSEGEAASVHVLRGGGWNTFSTNMRAANRFTSTLDGSASGVRCARAHAAGTADSVAPLEVVTLEGVIVSEGALDGAALFVSAFDALDADPATGRVAPGRSPLAEVRLTPALPGSSQPFALGVPRGGPYVLMAALEANKPTAPGGAGYAPAASTGGVGTADGGPIVADENRTGITIRLRAMEAPGAGPPGRR